VNARRPEAGAIRFDFWLLAAGLALMGLGLIMVMSASGIMAERIYDDKYLFFRKQAMFAGMGIVVMIASMYANRKFFYRLTYFWLVLIFVLLALTVASPLAVNAGGASRWLRLGPLSFQPLEFAKPALVFYLAYFFAEKREQLGSFSVGFLPPVLVTGGLCGILLLQPDFGGAVLLAALLFMISLVGGARFLYLGSSLLLALGAGWALIISTPYRFQRLSAFLDPFKDADNLGYQLVQSLYAFGSGGIWGQGLGAGKQKLLFLPEAHNDFILAVLGEELGFAGVSVFFFLMGLLVWRAFAVALNQEDVRDRFTAYGMALILGMGAVLNAAVVLGTVPPKGVPLPLISYGGSCLLVSCFAIGVLLNLSRQEARA
jgi:cell division protein FtsW